MNEFTIIQRPRIFNTTETQEFAARSVQNQPQAAIEKNG